MICLKFVKSHGDSKVRQAKVMQWKWNGLTLRRQIKPGDRATEGTIEEIPVQGSDTTMLQQRHKCWLNKKK